MWSDDNKNAMQAEEDAEAAKNKWGRPFGWFPQNTGNIAYPENKSPTAKFITRRSNIINAYANQQTSWADWGWRLFTVVITFPFFLITIPWVIYTEKKKRANAFIEKKTFTLKEFKEIKETRARLKTLLRSDLLTIKSECWQFKKVCVAYNKNDQEVFTEAETEKIVMYCDRGQAKRWDPSFLNGLIAKAEKKETQASATSSYEQTKAESIGLFRSPSFK